MESQFAQTAAAGSPVRPVQQIVKASCEEYQRLLQLRSMHLQDLDIINKDIAVLEASGFVDAPDTTKLSPIAR
jgi:hypothetical protein